MPEVLEHLGPDLLAPLADDLRGEHRTRMERALADLRRCLDVNLASPAGASAVLVALPCFLEQAEWEGYDDEDRRLRMRLVLELARRIRALPDMAVPPSASARLDTAWRGALERLRGRTSEPRRRP